MDARRPPEAVDRQYSLFTLTHSNSALLCVKDEDQSLLAHERRSSPPPAATCCINRHRPVNCATNGTRRNHQCGALISGSDRFVSAFACDPARLSMLSRSPYGRLGQGTSRRSEVL